MSTVFVSFFGLMIGYRLFLSLFSRFHLEKKVLSVVFVLMLSFDLIVIAVGTSTITIWGLQLGVFLLIFASPRLIERHLESLLRAQVVNFLDQVILSVQVGDSLRNSIKNACFREIGWRQFELNKAYSQLILAEHPRPLSSASLQNLFEELRWIDQGRTRVLEQLKSLRWHYKVQDDFRRKSVQVSQQTRIQAVVVSLLYVALLIFNISHFGFWENLRLILISMTFFVAGLVLIFILGRRIKWKV